MHLGSFQITREDIFAFAKLWDAQPFHLSDEAAQNSPLKALSASGWQTLSIMADFLEKNGHAFTGAKNVKWLKPLYPDVEMHIRLEGQIVRMLDPQDEIICEVEL